MRWASRIVLLLSASAVLGVSGVAVADPAACPVVPAYGGTDATITELRAMRDDQSHTCQALADRLDKLDADLLDGRTHSDAIPAKLDVLHADLVGDLGVHIASGSGVDPAAPALRVDTGADPSNAQTVKLDTSTATWANGNEAALRADLWFLIGLLCCAPFGFFFLRVVLP